MSSARKIDVLFVVDDEPLRSSLVRNLLDREFGVQVTASAEAALALAAKQPFTVALVDFNLSGLAAAPWLQKLKEAQEDCEALLLTEPATLDAAILAAELSGGDLILKPCSRSDVELRIRTAADRRQLLIESRQLKAIVEKDEPRIDAIAQFLEHAPGTATLDDVERAHVVEILKRERGNKARAAKMLGVNRRSLYRLIEKHKIELTGGNPAAGG